MFKDDQSPYMASEYGVLYRVSENSDQVLKV